MLDDATVQGIGWLLGIAFGVVLTWPVWKDRWDNRKKRNRG